MKKIAVVFLLMLSLAYSGALAQPCQTSFTYTVTGMTVQYTNTSGSDSATSLSFMWDFGGMSNFSSNTNPSFTYPALGTYTVCLSITDTSCHANPSMIYCQVITIDTTIVTPPPPPSEVSTSNVITPNGDGNDDVVELAIFGGEIKIYNRFGILVRTLDGGSRIWDAKDNSGVIVPMGYYVAINEVDNTAAHISVIR